MNKHQSIAGSRDEQFIVGDLDIFATNLVALNYRTVLVLCKLC